MKTMVLIRNGRLTDAEKVSLVWDEFMDFHKRISAMDSHMVPNVRDLNIAYFKKHVRSRIRKAIVAECDGRIVGFLLGSIQKRPPVFATSYQAYVDSIAVIESKRNQGIGGMMLDVFEKWAKEKKMPYVMLNVVVENAAAIRFYENRGFKTMILAQRKLL
jgi:ribosomal protein S18 acetylase RimI-like enzyme